MTLPELERLVADSSGEWEHIEFKKSTHELVGGMETLCGFLNGVGGRVFFGVTDGGRILGQDFRDGTFQEVANAIRKIEPSGHIEQHRIVLDASREVLVQEATPGADGPYTFDGRAYVRIGNTTSRMPQSQYERRLLGRNHSQGRWERQVAEGYTIGDLDTGELDRAMRAAVFQGRLEHAPSDTAESLDRLHLRENGQLLSAAVVLFGRRLMPDFPQCALRLARFRGTTKTEFLDQRQIYGHAFAILDEAVHFIMRHIPVAGRIEAGKLERTDTPLYPPLAFREALVNALCHRDYSVPGGAVNVAIFDDRLEIISSGLLPPGITVADLKRNHISHARNPLIAGVFFRRGLIEQWGRGTQKIVELCLEAGQPEPEFEEQAGAFTVRFIPGGYSPPLRVSHDLTERQRQVLLILSDTKEWTFPAIYSALEHPASERTVRRELRLLSDVGLAESKGRGQFARWRLVQPKSIEPDAL